MSQGARIPTSLRYLSVAELLASRDVALSRSEITRDLGLPKQTVYRLCSRMMEDGLLSMDRSKRFRPGPRLRRMCAGILFNASDHIARHQILARIAGQTGETVNLVMPEADGMRCVDRAETDRPFRVELPTGTTVPFHCTAGGKVYLASLPPARRRHFVDCLELRKITPNTKCAQDELLDELELIAKCGYALDREEFIESTHAVAVPVTDDDGRFLVSLACHGPAQRMSIDDAVSFVATMQTGACKLGAVLLG